jgi:pimeloyl-ACP methyl ester carboxylesterase
MGVDQALNLAKSLGIDPDAPIFICGGGDGYGTSIVSDYVDSRGNGNFLTHTNNSTAYRAIDIAYSLGKPVILIGHSWGGYAALDAANYAVTNGIGVDLLVTVDPVDGPVRMFNDVSDRNLVELRDSLGGPWVSVRATAYESTAPSRGDNIASIGGRMDTASQTQAHVYIESNNHHESFGRMMSDAKIEQMIKSVQQSYRRGK